jgi:exo-1,4-beta-D-glucosaminidase
MLGENVYWQSQIDDDAGDPGLDVAFELNQARWADMSALNYMTKVPLEVSAHRTTNGAGQDIVDISLRNPTKQIAFFERAEVTSSDDGDEILPIEYTDNYVTVFPGETAVLRAVVPNPWDDAKWIRVTGYNTAATVVRIS